jgi:hypothetical protein
VRRTTSSGVAKKLIQDFLLGNPDWGSIHPIAPKGSTIAAMRELFPVLTSRLQQPHILDSLAIQGQAVNWDAIIGASGPGSNPRS